MSIQTKTEVEVQDSEVEEFLLKNDSKVLKYPRLSIVSYYLKKSLCLFTYLIVSGRVHVLFEGF